jgi:UDP-2,3-diacylglucosamine pyrophosphatase LpxH
MLAFLSDLHFSDGTAASGEASPELFRLALGEVYAMAEQLAWARDEPTRLSVVLLGDIFDLLRTERWFEDREGRAVPLAERPWYGPEALDTGALTPAAAGHARAILAEIVEKNAGALAVIRGETAPPPPGVEVRRIYVPGNHDRLYLHDERLRDGIRAALGAADGAQMGEEGIRLHGLSMPEYGVVARHGHEWDAWSFPGYREDATAAEYTDADYLPAPISDAVITEMAARLPYELAQRLLEDRAFGAHEARRVHASMKRIEDVRPIFAAFRWAYYETERIGAHLGEPGARRLRIALDDSLCAIARAFRELPFYQAWAERRHEPFHPDAAWLLRIILCAMSSINAPLREVATIVERALVFYDPRDVGRRGAAREELGVVGRQHMRFVVYGHTHQAAQISLRGGVKTRDVYLNTGTYRPGVFRADDGDGFVGWQRLAYVVLSRAEEARIEMGEMDGTAGGAPLSDGGPAFVSWIGGRSAEAPRRVVRARRAV